MQPKFVEVWEAILCDIFFSPAVETRVQGYIELCREGGEFENITVDCTVKPTLPLVGQIGRNRSCARKISHAAPNAEQLHAVHLVRGASGSVLMVDPMFSEYVVASGFMYRERFTEKQRRYAKYFRADGVSPLLFETMRAVPHKSQ